LKSFRSSLLWVTQETNSQSCFDSIDLTTACHLFEFTEIHSILNGIKNETIVAKILQDRIVRDHELVWEHRFARGAAIQITIL
jgi:hypothetical protein